jgi:uncharacterized repeat protein (TIGR01451 family)
MAPGVVDNTTFTGTYTLTQADVDAGTFTNVATVSGILPDGSTTIDDTDDDTQVLSEGPAIELVKTGEIDSGGDGQVDAGDTITYAFTVSNIGNVTLTDVTITDPDATIFGGTIAILAPGAVDNTTITGQHILTQAEIDAGTFTNIATVTGTDPGGEDVTDTDDDTRTLNDVPELEATKATTQTTYTSLGEVINYTITVENTGNVTVDNINVTDPNATSITCSDGAYPYTLAPGESKTCAATHVVTLADLNDGSVVNIATVNGTNPSGGTVSDQSNQVTVTADQDPELTTIKSKATAINYSAVGQIVTYNIIVENTGNVTVNNINVLDDNADAGSITCTNTTLSVRSMPRRTSWRC